MLREHVFASSSNFAGPLRRFLAWLRAFALLEDPPHGAGSRTPISCRPAASTREHAHPHHRPLTPRPRRRTGAPAPRPQICLSPVAAARSTQQDRGISRAEKRTAQHH